MGIKFVEVKNKEEIKENTSDKTIIKFYATWCGPCKVLNDQLALYTGDEITVLSVNIEHSRELAKEYGVTALPTMVFLRKDGSKIKEYKGAMDLDKFNACVKETVDKEHWS